MIKLNSKLKSSTAYLVLVSYLIITITNAIHYHKIEFGKSYSILNPSEKNRNFHSFINGSIDFCPIQTAYHSLQNTVISSSDPFQNQGEKIDVVKFFKLSSKPLKTYTLHHLLRAPPKFT